MKMIKKGLEEEKKGALNYLFLIYSLLFQNTIFCQIINTFLKLVAKLVSDNK